MPDAQAADVTPCKSWMVKNFALGDTQSVNEFELPDGYEPINGDADYYKLLTVIGKKCVAY